MIERWIIEAALDCLAGRYLHLTKKLAEPEEEEGYVRLASGAISIGGIPTPVPEEDIEPPPSNGKRYVSAEVRAKMAAAQRKRWAKHRKERKA